ncbi:MAG TPA: hypothetical protein PK737_03400 [Bacilli bacterium]|nr:hypothetical protein [Bacilli bacterium]
MEENYKYNIDDLIALEKELSQAQEIYQVSGQESDQKHYQELMVRFKNLLTKHIIISAVKAYQYRSEEIEQLNEELKAKRIAYFGEQHLRLK